VKVNDRNSIVPLHKVRNLAEQAAKSEKSSQREAADKVSLSNEAQRMQEADAARIAELARAISEGRYQVDLERMAEAFVNKELP